MFYLPPPSRNATNFGHSVCAARAALLNAAEDCTVSAGAEQRLAALPAYEEEARLAAADREELDRLRDRVDVLERELAEAEERRARAESVADEMKASVSWRLTAPLRRLRGRQ